MKSHIKFVVVGLLSLALLAFTGCSNGGDDDDQLLLTVNNLQGTYELNIGESTINFDDDSLQGASGTLEIDGMTFRATLIATATDRGTFTLTGSTATTISDDGEVSTLQVAFSDNGNTLTLIDEAGDQLVLTRRDGSGSSNDVTLENLQGVYDLDVTLSTGLDFESDGFLIISGDLSLTDTTFELTATAQDESEGTFIIDGNTIVISEDDIGTSRLTAQLSETTLTLVDEDGDRLVFQRR